MKVEVKDLYLDIVLKTRGMELCIRDSDGVQIGDLVISKAGLTWCEGKTTPPGAYGSRAMNLGNG